MYLTKRGTTLNGDMDRHTIVMNRERPDGVTIWRLGKFLFAKVHRILCTLGPRQDSILCLAATVLQ